MSLPLCVRHHQQDKFDSCGRACAQMVIGFEFKRLGVTSGTALPDQLAMESKETGKMMNWATEPFELAQHINNGLQGHTNAKRWEMVEFKASPGTTGDAATLEVASSLFDVVAKKLDQDFPSVVMIDANDHWETAFNYRKTSTDAFLYTIDPMPVLVSSLGTPHSDIDACSRTENTIWFLNAISASALVCDAPDFVGSAIGIVQTDPTDWWVPTDPKILRGINEVPAHKPAPDPRFRDAWRERVIIKDIRNPLPPHDKNLPLIALMNFFRRDMWRMNEAMERLPSAASYSDFDWSRVVVRHAAYLKDRERRLAIVAAPPREGKERSILLSINERGALDAIHLTSSGMMVKSLADAGDEPLWIVPKYSRWLPFVRTTANGPSPRFRRLYDGFEMDMKHEGHESR
jgi:hypothetical protein